MAKVEMDPLTKPEMERGGSGVGSFGAHESMFVSQTRKGCTRSAWAAR